MIAVALVVLFTIYNILGVKEAAIMANITLVAKMVPMILILLAALFMGNIMPDLDPTPVTSTGEPASLWSGISMVSFAVLASLWAYEGLSLIHI